MQKVGFIVLLFLIIGTFFIFLRNDTNTNPIPQPEPISDTPSVTPRQSGTQSSWIITDSKNISLHSNLIDKLTALEAQQKYACESIINGGFYSAAVDPTKENTHIGLFIEDGEVIQKEQSNSLFNGYFSAMSRTATIAAERPTGPRFALQTGPILISDGQIKLLKLTRDEEARRMVAGITADKKVIFITFYDASSLVSGPKLVDLPRLVEELSTKNGLQITDAINLDGGAHSAFISNEVQLTDIQTPGSYFCVKN